MEKVTRGTKVYTERRAIVREIMEEHYDYISHISFPEGEEIYIRGTCTIGQNIARGSEGCIYEIEGEKDKVIKIFNEKSSLKEKRILALSKFPWTEKARSYLVLPLELVYVDEERHEFIGYVMERIDASYLLSDAYSERHPLSTYKRAVLALNLCNVVTEIHKNGNVCIGDFSAGNVAVDRATGNVRIFDIDDLLHFGAKNVDQTINFPCNVLKPSLYMPEIIELFKNNRGKSLEDLYNNGYETFTKYTDYYCLAYHIHLLLLQCQPFGRVINPELVNDSVPLPNGLSMACKGYYSYYKLPEGTRLPDSFPDFNVITPKLQKLFIRAFVDGATDPTKRPTGEEFREALCEYIDGLKYCHCDNWNHYLHKSFKGHSCEWCRMEKVVDAKIKINADDIQYAAMHELERLVDMPNVPKIVKEGALMEQCARYAGIADVVEDGYLNVEKDNEKEEECFLALNDILNTSAEEYYQIVF